MKVTIGDGEVALVIIGAGWSGVTALTVARAYIPKSEKIVIADIRNDYGGQWVDTYDFVRLHQPYRIYTSFNQTWSLKKPREYLATRSEVMTHFRDLGRRAGAHELFSHRYIGHKEVEGRDDLLEVHFMPVKDETEKGDNMYINQKHSDDYFDNVVKIRTKRLIKGCAILHRNSNPFELSSPRVQSIDIRQLSADVANGMGKCDTHYVIVGSGKSGMDAANYIHDNCDLTKTTVSMITGKGVAFMHRDELFPTSRFGRHFRGTDLLSFFIEYALKWDGTNQASLLREMEERGLLISAVPDPYSCMYGVLSDEELDKVKCCVHEMIRGRMCDIVDRADGTGLDVVMSNSDETVPLTLFDPRHRTVVVNCTDQTYDNRTVRPLVQDGGKTLELQLVFLSPGGSTSYLTHAWFSGRLGGKRSILNRLIRLEVPNGEHERDRLFFAVALVGLHNFGILMNCVSPSVLLRDKGNVLLWFPLWRQVQVLLKLKGALPHISQSCLKLFGHQKYPIDEIQKRKSL